MRVKRELPQNKPIEIIKYCGDCLLAKCIEDKHLNIKGESILISCPHSEFYKLKSQKACTNGRFK